MMVAAWAIQAPTQAQAPAGAPALAGAPPATATIAGPCPRGLADSLASCSGRPLDGGAHVPLTAVGDLSTGRLGRPYRTTVVRGGAFEYVWDEVTGLPLGLGVGRDGRLTGTPQQAGVFQLHLEAHDRSDPLNGVRADLSLRIAGPPSPIQVKIDQKPPPPPPPDGDKPGEFTLYCLTVSDLAMIDGGQRPKAPDAPPKPLPPNQTCAGRVTPAAADAVVPPVQTVTAQLTPIVNVEYPTRALFDAALKERLGEALTPAARAAIVGWGAKTVHFNEAPSLRWRAAPGCDCVPAHRSRNYRTVYGFFPFWRATADGPPVTFSLFDRVGLLGVQLTDEGDWLKPTTGPKSWWSGVDEFARAAHAHGAQLDLVLQRNSWTSLASLSPSQISALANYSAKSALDLADARPTDAGAFWRGLLWPFWHGANHQFDGVTVMFAPPASSGPVKEAYELFYDEFLTRLIEDMKSRKRPYGLNIVVADSNLCKPSEEVRDCTPPSPTLDSLMYYKHLAEPRQQHPPVAAEDAASYIGTTDISVKFLTTLPEFTGKTKKALRQRIDYVKDGQGQHAYEGAARVNLLQTIIPVISPLATIPTSNLENDDTRIEKDMPYFDQNFGGAGVWPIPVAGDPAGLRVERAIASEFFQELRHRFDAGEPKESLNPFTFRSTCNTALRLIWQLTVCLIPIAVIFYFLIDASPGVLRTYVFATMALTAVMTLLGFYLLNFDPALDRIKMANGILYGVACVGALGGLWFGLKDRVRDP